MEDEGSLKGIQGLNSCSIKKIEIKTLKKEDVQKPNFMKKLRLLFENKTLVKKFVQKKKKKILKRKYESYFKLFLEIFF